MPLHDTYFAEPLRELFDALVAKEGAAAGAGGMGAAGTASRLPAVGSELTVELFGVLKAGRTQLRLRVAEVAKAAMAPGAGLTSLSAWREPPDASSRESTTAAAAAAGAEAVEANYYYDTGAVPPDRAAADTTPDGALYAALRDVGVSASVLESLKSLGLGASQLLTTGVRVAAYECRPLLPPSAAALCCRPRCLLLRWLCVSCC